MRPCACCHPPLHLQRFPRRGPRGFPPLPPEGACRFAQRGARARAQIRSKLEDPTRGVGDRGAVAPRGRLEPGGPPGHRDTKPLVLPQKVPSKAPLSPIDALGFGPSAPRGFEDASRQQAKRRFIFLSAYLGGVADRRTTGIEPAYDGATNHYLTSW